MIRRKFDKSLYFLLFSNVIFTEGPVYGILFDLHLRTYIRIPNSLFRIIEHTKEKRIAEIMQFFQNEYDEDIERLLTKLVNDNFGFFTNQPNLFPPISTDWKSPSQITNAILCYSDLTGAPVFEELEHLGCMSLEIRFDRKVSKEEILQLLLPTKTSTISNIELIFPFFDNYEEDFLEIIKKNLRVNRIIFYNSVEEKHYELKNCSIILTRQNINNKSCGIISESYFVSDITLYTESLHFNSCLNRKIAIDDKGNIKNCPSMAKSYGNIQDTTLGEAMEKSSFKDIWTITKDKIHVCKDCEFRYICTDCRAYVEDPEDLLSKPLKCGYNPYTGEWSEWTTNPLKQNGIDFYEMRDLVAKD